MNEDRRQVDRLAGEKGGGQHKNGSFQPLSALHGFITFRPRADNEAVYVYYINESSKAAAYSYYVYIVPGNPDWTRNHN